MFIQQGACNPIAIAGTIHQHMLTMSKAGRDHNEIRNDPAIRLMLHQLAYLCRVFEMETCTEPELASMGLADLSYSKTYSLCKAALEAQR
jgi:hypothetical protein